MTNPLKPILVHYQAGSVTPLTGYGSNTAFLVIDVDVDTLLPTNMHSHWFDLADANSSGIPVWQTHDFLEEYELPDLSPAAMLDLATRIKNDPDFASTWVWNKKNRFGDKQPIEPDDQSDEFCNLVTSSEYERFECEKSKGKSRSAYGQKPPLKSFSSLLEFLIGDWISVNK